MKVVLVRPNYKSHIITPPLGIGYISSYLKSNGIETVIIDALKEGLTNQQVVDQVLSHKPVAVGITCLTAFYNEVVDLSRRLKKRNVRSIIGGVHPTFLPKETLVDSKADFVVCGEAENALLQLIQNNFVHSGISGVYSLSDFKTKKVNVTKALPVQDLDSLPLPDWEQMDPNSYPKAPHGAIVKNFPIGVITTTRGCPYECTFCASPKFYDRRIRFRSPESVVDEILYLKKNFKVKEIHFEDDNLTLKREHIEKICNLMIKNKVGVSWACPNGIRADKVDEALIRLMKKAGCYYFAYGVESADPQILKNVKKGESIEKINSSIALADSLGISCQGFFIFGLPGETKETLEKNINFAKNSRLSRAQFLILDVLPGSELWDELQGKFKPDWSKNSYKEPEWLPEGLTKQDLMSAQSTAFRKFYLRPEIFFMLLKEIKPSQALYLVKRLVEYRIVK
jgi:radical SAM superfamily enzyme YgiQ (UPF0313 family)